MVKKYAAVYNKDTGYCMVFDEEVEGTELLDVTFYPMDKRWYLTSKFEEDSIKVMNRLAYYKEQKYQEITDMYDKVCKYGVTPVAIIVTDIKKGTVIKKEYYANRSWLSTWREVLDGLSITHESVFVRLYEKLDEKHYRNITLKNINSEQYSELYLQLINFRFNSLQPIRNRLYSELENLDTVESIMALKPDFECAIIDEQNDIEHMIVKEQV